MLAIGASFSIAIFHGPHTHARCLQHQHLVIFRSHSKFSFGRFRFDRLIWKLREQCYLWRIISASNFAGFSFHLILKMYFCLYVCSAAFFSPMVDTCDACFLSALRLHECRLFSVDKFNVQRTSALAWFFSLSSKKSIFWSVCTPDCCRLIDVVTLLETFDSIITSLRMSHSTRQFFDAPQIERTNNKEKCRARRHIKLKILFLIMNFPRRFIIFKWQKVFHFIFDHFWLIFPCVCIDFYRLICLRLTRTSSFWRDTAARGSLPLSTA